MTRFEITESDARLLPFLSAPDGPETEAWLSQLISEQTEQIIKRIIRNKLRVSLIPIDGSYANQEAVDLIAEVQIALVAGLRALKSDPGSKTFNNFDGYVAAVTINACNHWLRRKYPRRSQLKNKLRYLLSHDSKFALWEGDERDWLCGLASWRGTERVTGVESRLQELREQPAFKTAARAGHQRQALTELLCGLFEELPSAVLLDELVTVVADQLQIREDTATADYEHSSRECDELGTSASVLTELEQRAQLKQLWSEICQLPLRHRSALLLNLRDRHGADTLALLPLTRVATIQQIAEVLGFDPQRFARVWTELPWDDITIAKHLELTRQQVINLRQSARARLARQVKQREVV
jgi:hypothetical protein